MTILDRIEPLGRSRPLRGGARLVRLLPFAPGALLLVWTLVRAAG